MQRLLTGRGRARERGGFWRSRRCSVALATAILAIPVAGLAGLAIDFGFYSELQGSLQAAANTAALNAVKAAAAGYANSDPNYVAEGTTAGKQWFAVALGPEPAAMGATVGTPGVSLSQSNLQLTATVTYTATMRSVFGGMFGVPLYNAGGAATAAWNVAPFLEVVMLLDNSGSMDIGATPADIQTLMTNSICDPSNAWVWNGSAYKSKANYAWANYQCSYGGGTYDGPLACPYVANGTTYAPNSSQYYPSYACPKVGGQNAYAGPPCAFACHFDSSQPAGQGNDLWAMARRLGVTTRFDLVKNATNAMLTQMQTDNTASANLSVGVYTFDMALTEVYPASGEAGSDFNAAISAVGSPPAAGSGSYTDTGIQPTILTGGTHNSNTNYQEAMNALASNYVTQSGDGQTAATPKKVLFLVTDGMDDESSGTFSAMASSYCQQFKTMGYTVYVVYTPYYPLEFWLYEQTIMPWVEGTGSNTIAYNLQQCSSSTSSSDLSTYYIQANNASQLTNALQQFLKQAIVSLPARFTQ